MVPLRRRQPVAPSPGRGKARARPWARALLRLVAWLCRGLLLVLVAAWRSGRFVLGRATRVMQWLCAWALSHPRPAADGAVLALSAWALAVLVSPDPPIAPGTKLAADKDNRTCLALNIYHEARGEPLKGQVAVAQVVLNRVAHVRFPNEICAVIKDGGEWPRGFCQFSWWCDGLSDAPLESKAWRESMALAGEILSGAHNDPTRGALWYHATSVAPAWRRDFDRTGRIGDHIFYRPRRRAN